MSLAILPGTFDPITLGHVDLVTRAAPLFEGLVVGVAAAPGSWLSQSERLALAGASLAHLPGVRVEPFEGLAYEWARQRGARLLVRGLRLVSDFEQELAEALALQALAPELEVVSLLAAPQLTHVGSAIVREVAKLGGDVTPFVPAEVVAALAARRAAHP